jgi:hypothetical protein
MATEPTCFRCEEVETMEHLLYGCENYSAKVWAMAGKVLTLSLSRHSGDFIPRIDLTPLEIVFNKPHPSILLDVPGWYYQKDPYLIPSGNQERPHLPLCPAC